MDSSLMERLVVDLATDARERLFGKFRGTVADVEDPESLGRIKALVPRVYDDVVSPWAVPCTPYAGEGVGFYAIPPVGSLVWIEFEEGDKSRPIWSGAAWARDELPKDEKGGDTAPPLKILRSEQGLMLALDDSGNTATVSDKDGNNLVTIKSNEGQIRIEAVTKVVVEAPQIELVDGAPHPLVFGDDLLNYLNQLVNLFNTHMHPGETVIGIPVTPIVPAVPFPPAMPSLLSVKVKTG
jgi:hypothetical protein